MSYGSGRSDGGGSPSSPSRLRRRSLSKLEQLSQRERQGRRQAALGREAGVQLAAFNLAHVGAV